MVSNRNSGSGEDGGPSRTDVMVLLGALLCISVIGFLLVGLLLRAS